MWNAGVSDDSLVNILASLAAETADDMSHDVSRELCDDDVGLADADAMLSSPAVMRLSAEDRREIAEESLEMSQRVWDEDMQTDTSAAAAERRDADDMYVLHTHTRKRQWVAVASAGPYASLHLAPDRQPRQHPTTQFITGRMPFLPPNQQRQCTEGMYVLH